VELLVVLSIIVVLTGAVTINLNRGRDQKDVKAAAEILRMQILEARAEAMIPSEEARQTTSIQMRVDNCSSSPIASPGISVKRSEQTSFVSKVIEFGGKVRISSSTCTLTFEASRQETLGQIAENNVQFRVTDDKNTESYILSVNKYSGISTYE